MDKSHFNQLNTKHGTFLLNKSVFQGTAIAANLVLLSLYLAIFQTSLVSAKRLAQNLDFFFMCKTSLISGDSHRIGPHVPC